MVIAELVGGFVLWEGGYKEWIWETNLLGAGLGILSLIVFEGMPCVLMLLERSEVNETTHGHGEKPIISAVPTIGKMKKLNIEDKKTN